jgi:threonine dehydrogenase-like Zn-dependent dehydrogenase
MKAVMYEGENRMRVVDEKAPGTAGVKDATLRVTISAICGSDLHMYEGRIALPKSHVVGHEIMGVIERVG